MRVSNVAQLVGCLTVASVLTACSNTGAMNRLLAEARSQPAAEAAADPLGCDSILIPWRVGQHDVSGTFVLHPAKQRISDFRSSDGTNFASGSVPDLKVEGKIMAWTTFAGHALVATVNKDCQVLNLKGEGSSASGTYIITLDRQTG